MCETRIILEGTIKFDPKDVTNKHKKQSSWKRTALIELEGDISQYYAWFLKDRFKLDLAPPLRGSHITFINDRASDMNGKWDEVKNKWENKKIKVVLDVRPHASKSKEFSEDGGHWWLIIPHYERGEIQSIRNELGLGKPFFGLHMTIGKAVNMKPKERNDANAVTAKKMNIEHSDYVIDLIEKGIVSFED